MNLVITNAFSPGTVALSGLVNQNFTEVATIINGGIDYGNINTTSGTTPGLIASQFLPTTTAQGTFSATTTGVGYTFLAGSTTAVPLAITGVSSQNADLFDVNLIAAGTKVFKIDKLGQGSFTSGATGSTPLAVNMIASQSVDGLQVNGAASITGNIFAAYLTPAGTEVFAVTSSGLVASNGPIRAGAFNTAHFDSTAAFMGGTPGSNSIGLEFGNAISVAGTSGISSSASTVSGVTGSAFLFYYNTSNNLAAIDDSGDFGVLGSLTLGSNQALTIPGTAPAINLGTSSGGAGSGQLKLGAVSGISTLQTTTTFPSGTAIVGSGIGLFAGAAIVMTVSTSGNMGIAGTLSSSSLLSLKQNIAPISRDAIALISETEWIEYNYKSEEGDELLHRHLGYGAENTDPYLSGPKHQHGYEPGSIAALACQAIKDMTARLKAANVAGF